MYALEQVNNGGKSGNGLDDRVAKMLAKKSPPLLWSVNITQTERLDGKRVSNGRTLDYIKTDILKAWPDGLESITI